MTASSQADRVLAALAGNPARGITAVDFLRLPTIDGLPPITRLAARILELREQGHRIVSGETRDRCRVYRLSPAAGSASVPKPPSPCAPATAIRECPASISPTGTGADPAAGGQLFSTTDQEFDAMAPRNAIDDDLEAA